MKKSILLGFLFFTLFSISAQTIINVPYGVQFISSSSYYNNHGIGGGYRNNYGIDSAKLIYTTDSNIWAMSVYPLNLQKITNVQLVNEQIGYASAMGGGTGLLLKTTDGGISWNTYGSLESCTAVNGLFFVNESVGFLTIDVIAGSKILKTTDGGSTWNSSYSSPSISFRKIRFGDMNTGFINGIQADSSFLFKTTNNGESWIKNLAYKAYLRDISFSDSLTYYFIRNDSVSTAYKTTNAGVTWLKMNIPESWYTIFQMINFYPGSNVGFIFWDNLDVPHYLKTTDSGNTWSESYPLPLGDYVSSTMASQNRWYLTRASISGTGSILFIDGNTPVELNSFNAVINSDKVYLKWTTATEKNNKGFMVQRKYQSGEWEDISFIAGEGTSTEVHSYSYTERLAIPGKYYYRLKQTDYDGRTELSKEFAVDFTNDRYTLEQNYPNPFNPVTMIKYSIPVHAYVELRVTDILGNIITELVKGERDSGVYETEFNAGTLPSGIYFYTLSAGNYKMTKKLLLLK